MSFDPISCQKKSRKKAGNKEPFETSFLVIKYSSIVSLGIKFDITFETGPVALEFQRPSAHKHSVQQGPNFSKKEPARHKGIGHFGKPQRKFS